jgi:hypothetical protein
MSWTITVEPLPGPSDWLKTISRPSGELSGANAKSVVLIRAADVGSAVSAR